MKEEVRKLWELCFDDKKEFIDLYFDQRYCDDINVFIKEKDLLIAALQTIPYCMSYYDKLLEIAYISGACTHPDFRAKGVMKKLLEKTHRNMYEKGIMISTLIPAEYWLFDYYSKTGYIPSFLYTTICAKVNMLNSSNSLEIEIFENRQTDVYPFFKQKMTGRNFCIQHSREDFNLILTDLHLGGGNLFVCREQQKIIGLAFCIVHGASLSIFEWLVESVENMKPMFHSIALKVGCKELSYKIPSEEKGKPKGMARMIHAKKALQYYAKVHPEKKLTFQLFDEQISQNNGLYILNDGICHYSVVNKEIPTVTKINISRLTELFFESEQAQMSLMLD